jgi:asparagine synthase (glutamine-hydrolysing)
VKTFSIGFEDEAYNELPFARLVAERYGTDHHEFIVKPDAAAILPDLVWHYNEPYADSSAIPSYYLAKLAREHVTVALNGDAGDENFAGYDRYAANVLARHYRRLPRLLRASLEWAGRALPDLGGPRGPVRRAKRFVAAAGDEPWRRYARWVGIFDEASKGALYGPAFQEATVGRDSIDLLRRAYEAADADLVDAPLGADVSTYLPDDLLVKVDIASMAHSLEARSPMVDHVFMEFAARLPSSLKLRGRTGKYIFRTALRGRLPDAIVDRPKMGFGVPIERWFRVELRELAYDTLLGRAATQRGLFHPGAVRRLLDEHVAGRRAGHSLLWALLMLELWFERFIDERRLGSA